MANSNRIETDTLREQPLSSNEKKLLSEYFQLEGQRQFENYHTMLSLAYGRVPNYFDLLSLPTGTLNDLADKQLTLELSQRDHWINLMSSIHDRFYEKTPNPYEIQMWAFISIAKHSIVQIETGQEEYKQLLREAQQRQIELIARVGEGPSKQFAHDIDLFYQLLDLDGLNKNLILFS